MIKKNDASQSASHYNEENSAQKQTKGGKIKLDKLKNQ